MHEANGSWEEPGAHPTASSPRHVPSCPLLRGPRRWSPHPFHPPTLYNAHFFVGSLVFFSKKRKKKNPEKKKQWKTPPTTLNPAGPRGVGCCRHPRPGVSPGNALRYQKIKSINWLKVPFCSWLAGKGQGHARGHFVTPAFGIEQVGKKEKEKKKKRCFSLVLCIYIKNQESFVCFYCFNYCYKKLAFFFKMFLLFFFLFHPPPFLPPCFYFLSSLFFFLFLAKGLSRF